ncbi:phage tail protein [Allorhizobium sp. BGMRC 0089]|uniref:phage tail tube protein n=1 Tax=Allorhizobium sonneratiae TaxID=2934936 RepID=UPI0020340B1A|nr:phage tail tube protein [Allorhizobium sonneratiae]MCM2292295.1 phage tail protein [Allorhizobium sonneratiae]
MAQATAIRGGKIRVLIGNDANPIVYTAPCGFTSRSVSLNKGLEETSIPDCDDPDTVDWIGRDASSLSMSVTGEGVLAQESVETWLDAWESIDSVPVKIEIEFPAKTVTWTGLMHVEKFELSGDNGKRATANISMQSDGKMLRVVAAK